MPGVATYSAVQICGATSHNLLLQCFFQTNRFELGEQLAATVIAQGVANDCFENNHFLFRLLAKDGSRDILANYDKSTLTNPFTRFNHDIASEIPASWSRDGRPSLKSKLLFQDFRFGTTEKRRKAQTMFFDCGDGYAPYSLQTPIITLGRFDSNNIPFNQNGISRRHAVIVNHPDDVWIYDLDSVVGTSVDGIRVRGKAFLDGVHTVDIGTRKIRIATVEGLLI